MELKMDCNPDADFYYSHGSKHIKCVLNNYYEQGPNTYAPHATTGSLEFTGDIARNEEILHEWRIREFTKNTISSRIEQL